MAQNSDNAPDEREGEQDEVLKELDQIDERLLGRLDDPRLSNGIPSEQRRDDLSFIQMSGMTSPEEGDTPRVLPPLGDTFDLDTTKPLSFYEKGVRDVDAEMAPGGALDTEGMESALAPAPSTGSAMPPLRDIIADLSEKARAAEASDKEPKAPEEIPSIPTETSREPVREELIGTPDTHPPRRDSFAVPTDLRAAEKLLQEIEADAPMQAGEAFAVADDAAYEQTPETGLSPDARMPDPEDAEAKERRRGKRRSRARNQMGVLIARMSVAAITLGMLGFLGYEGYRLYQSRFAGPETLYDQASVYASRGEYLKAADAYAQFAARQKDSPLRPEAQFAAAYALRESRPTSKDEAKRVYEKALSQFQEFLTENPTSPKAARAQILMGILSFELGKYQQAIEMLQDPDLRLRDPAAAVPMLRTLARSYSKLGDEESARSYYLQSTGIEGNLTPDVDFEELGMLYHSLAERAEQPNLKARYVEQALQQWGNAIQLTGIDPTSKASIRNKVEVLRGKSADGGEGTLPPETPAADSETPLEETPAETSEPESSEQPVDGAAMAPAEEGGSSDTQELPQEPQAPSDPSSEAVAPESAPAPVESEPTPAATEKSGAESTTAPPAPAGEPEQETMHTVKPGETLSMLGRRYNVTVTDLRAWNGLRDDVI
ncbi:MAG: LysM peptidoglycan-binding domain-containing protein, partial [Candidatus Hydrogenedentales bacterium]